MFDCLEGTCERMWTLSAFLVSVIFISEINQESGLLHFKKLTGQGEVHHK